MTEDSTAVAAPGLSGSAEPTAVAPRAAGRARTAAWLAKQVEVAVGQVELSLPQYRVLGLLDEGSSASSAVAERLAVRPPSVTSVVDGLVARGLVTRRPEQGDRRRVSLVLTPEGHRVLAGADAAADQRLGAIAGGLGPAEGGRALDDLGLWQQALVAHHRARTTRR